MSTGTGSGRAYVGRHAQARIKTVMADTRIVAIVGPRQSGKTTLIRRIAERDRRRFVSLDSDSSLQFARNDPAGFVRKFPCAAIDEIQRAPNLVLELKLSVDEDQIPGRYLVTGSVDLFKSALLPDSLAGRVSVVQLLPFSQAEIGRRPPSQFLARAFAADFPEFAQTDFTDDLVSRVLTGGYPQAVFTKSMNRRQQMLREYAELLASRDLPRIMEVRKDVGRLYEMVEHAAAASGTLVNLARLAGVLKVDIKTIDRWLVLLEQMFLIRRVRAWHRNQAKRLIRSPKLHFIDSGVLAAIRHVNAQSMENDRCLFASLLESFVFSELIKLLPSHESPVHISHYRTRAGHKVDFVLETPDGNCVGIEVKAATSVYPKDFRGLHRFAEAAGDGFAAGIVLYDGAQILQVADKMFALPVSALWQLP